MGATRLKSWSGKTNAPASSQTKYLQRLGDRRTEVPATGETVKLVEAGNHAQGCIFRDGSHLWSEALEHRIDAISQRLDGFFIGRYDIRYSSADDLRAGSNFQIIELNGAASEATNIYDARNSLSFAYRTLFRQWELVFAIGAATDVVARRRRSCRCCGGSGAKPAHWSRRIRWPTDSHVHHHFLARRNGCALGVNRDEKLTRVAALPPSRLLLGGRTIVCPSEPNGGTWIGVNDAGATLRAD